MVDFRSISLYLRNILLYLQNCRFTGPRNCIGLRLGKLQTKVGLAVMLQHHTFELESEAANKEIKFTPKAVLIAPTDAIKLRIKRRPVNKFL